MLESPEGGKVWVYDLEVFPNYFLAIFYDGITFRRFERTPLRNELPTLVGLITDKSIFAGFNNFEYDDLMLLFVHSHGGNVTPEQIYEHSQSVINDGISVHVSAMYGRKPWKHSIDVHRLLDGKGSLKLWECHNGAKSVVESPLPFYTPIKASDVPAIVRYCTNDVVETWRLLVKYWSAVGDRKMLRDMFSMSTRLYTETGQGVAELVVCKLHTEQYPHEKKAQIKENAASAFDNCRKEYPINELLSDQVKAIGPDLSALISSAKSGRVVRYDDEWELDLPGIDVSAVNLFGASFSLGVGGIHTNDAPGRFESDADNVIIDLDVTSYYPSLIIKLDINPEQMPQFAHSLERLTIERVKAKVAGDKPRANALKLVVNSLYGKLRCKTSPLYSPRSSWRVTVNGQFYLMMLAERMSLIGAEILSTNTDGITLRVQRDLVPQVQIQRALWERDTEMCLEEAQYDKYYRKDVNSYIALNDKGEIKGKNAFLTKPSLQSPNASTLIVPISVERFLLDGTPIEDTIRACTDPLMFADYCTRNSSFELLHNGTPVGKVCRYLHTVDGAPLIARNKKTCKDAQQSMAHAVAVANEISEGVPENLDFQYYIDQAHKLAEATLPQPGPAKKPRTKKPKATEESEAF